MAGRLRFDDISNDCDEPLEASPKFNKAACGRVKAPEILISDMKHKPALERPRDAFLCAVSKVANGKPKKNRVANANGPRYVSRHSTATELRCEM